MDEKDVEEEAEEEEAEEEEEEDEVADGGARGFSLLNTTGRLSTDIEESEIRFWIMSSTTASRIKVVVPSDNHLTMIPVQTSLFTRLSIIADSQTSPRINEK